MHDNWMVLSISIFPYIGSNLSVWSIRSAPLSYPVTLPSLPNSSLTPRAGRFSKFQFGFGFDFLKGKNRGSVSVFQYKIGFTDENLMKYTTNDMRGKNQQLM